MATLVAPLCPHQKVVQLDAHADTEGNTHDSTKVLANMLPRPRAAPVMTHTLSSCTCRLSVIERDGPPQCDSTANHGERWQCPLLMSTMTGTHGGVANISGIGLSQRVQRRTPSAILLDENSGPRAHPYLGILYPDGLVGCTVVRSFDLKSHRDVGYQSGITDQESSENLTRTRCF
jgi:hypothetical protein